ncbi:channel protein (hemolysin III family) [Tamilnaduibacter salinus]|uniref:Hemolysin III n=1 Tax=Tamilnaduibacter salinus TaxID=1484056 RepID=A0A2A2I268_9GAMM|nr:hemolysin III family protein [Tamilnaduibacter salinus]PAV25692.1 hemolysin III [Tamilnaduibacter salinus]PVY79231.1 channel protein (hemolysin III family) [Tamilnaduibacter salinus]
MSTQAQTNDYPVIEELINWLTHGIAALCSVAGMVVLIVLASQEANPWKIVSFSIYGTSMTLLFLASTLYHAARKPRARRLFKMFDHCAIFLLIAGTYTPFLLVNLRGAVGWTLFGIIWTLALGGILLKLIYGHRHKALQVTVYLLMGWLIVFASAELAASVNSTGLWLVVAGGITYTLGVVFYVTHAIPFNHAIWHLFVIGGAACHFFAVFFGVLA